ncbi:unnamed protein product [Soboliphyme baturini]|uniref:Transcriptional regulator n=1 Tax=Soboliphyme baturini TaxID=241478 RepID=A0A183I8W1_9BILA|nr:unnamed protein product [Soboliphyme baturini]
MGPSSPAIGQSVASPIHLRCLLDRHIDFVIGNQSDDRSVGQSIQQNVAVVTSRPLHTLCAIIRFSQGSTN